MHVANRLGAHPERRAARALIVLTLALLMAALAACKSKPTPSAEPTPAPAADEGTETAEEADLPSENPIDNPFFWEVRREGDVDYMLGTMHAKFQLGDLPVGVRDQLDAATSVAVEIDMNEVNPMALMMRATLPPEQSLRAMLGEAHWDKLVSALGDTFPPATLDRLQPWLIGQVLVLGELMDSDPNKAMDMAVIQRAKSAEIPVVFLEDANDQIELLIELGSLESLKESLDELDALGEHRDALVETYGSGDLDRLREIMIESEMARRDPEGMKRLLDDRNRAWMEQLPALLAKERAFVAVGAGHFVGEQGLITLLEEAGYEVERVNFAPPAPH